MFLTRGPVWALLRRVWGFGLKKFRVVTRALLAPYACSTRDLRVL